MIARKKKTCSDCGEERYMWSKGRCQPCAKKTYSKLGPAKNTPKKIDIDTAFYQEIWDEREHYCVECVAKLGRVDAAFLGRDWIRANFAHILGKGAHPRFRLVKENIVLLCYSHHSQLDFGKKKELKIWAFIEERSLEIMKRYISN